MRGTVKWFDSKNKGYGFITDSDGKDHFVHHSSIQSKGYRFLNEEDIVEFEVGQGANGKVQAVNVQPILTRKMFRNALKKENLKLKILNEASGNRAYMVVDANNVIQTGEQGLSLIEVAAYAGIDTEGLE
mgnify:CR=1 FL=1